MVEIMNSVVMQSLESSLASAPSSLPSPASFPNLRFDSSSNLEEFLEPEGYFP